MEKSIIARITFISVFAFLLFNFTFAEIPQLIQYQGKATEIGTGLPLTGNHNITFRLYDSATTGTIQWQEQHLNVPVSNGNFAVLLGSVDPVGNPLNLSFDQPYWLSVEINNDGEMSPRERLASVPYAYYSAQANHAEQAAEADHSSEADHATIADSLTQPEVPTGTIFIWSGSSSTVPDGWLMCDGSAVSRATYSSLFSVIGITYGNGDGSTTFNLPDLRGRFLLGKDSMGGLSADRVTAPEADNLGQGSGEEEHTLTIAEMPSHSHGHRSGVGVGNGFAKTTDNNHGQPDSGLISNTGDGNPHNNMPPYITLNYIIRI